jgi:hypothetical protein
VGLAALAHADHEFRLPAKVADRVMMTAVRLHAFDGPGCVWPWRGWGAMESSANPAAFELREGVGPELRDSIRAAMATLPMATGDKAVLLRHLGALSDGSQWLHKLRSLPKVSETDEPGVRAALDAETSLAAIDHISRPSMLLHVQACLPWVPKEESQHSVHALSELIWRLSSSVNVRTVRQRDSGLNFDEELLRITSFVEKQAETEQQVSAKRMALEKYDPMWTGVEGKAKRNWSSALETMHLTPHEMLMVKVITSVQRTLRGSTADAVDAAETAPRPRLTAATEPVSAGAGAVSGRGRAPTAFESRTAFLQLFGMRHTFSLPTVEGGSEESISVTIAGTPEQPLLVQRLSDEAAAYNYIESGTVFDRAADALLQAYQHGRDLKVPPCCPGFAWSCPKRAVLAVRFASGEGRKLAFFVDDVEIPAFEASRLLIPANSPDVALLLCRPRAQELLAQILYSSPISAMFSEDPMLLLIAAEKEAARALEADDCAPLDWYELGSSLPKAFWRDLAVKLQTRENDILHISPVGRDGRRTGNAVQPMTEGTMLRVLIALQMVYPRLLQRRGELSFRLTTEGKANAETLTHLLRTVSLLAFGSFDSGDETSQPPAAAGVAGDERGAVVPVVQTKLWPHQAEACRKTLAGIKQGKRGFADASAVGAGAHDRLALTLWGWPAWREERVFL